MSTLGALLLLVLSLVSRAELVFRPRTVQFQTISLNEKLGPQEGGLCNNIVRYVLMNPLVLLQKHLSLALVTICWKSGMTIYFKGCGYIVQGDVDNQIVIVAPVRVGMYRVINGVLVQVWLMVPSVTLQVPKCIIGMNILRSRPNSHIGSLAYV